MLQLFSKLQYKTVKYTITKVCVLTRLLLVPKTKMINFSLVSMYNFCSFKTKAGLILLK